MRERNRALASLVAVVMLLVISVVPASAEPGNSRALSAADPQERFIGLDSATDTVQFTVAIEPGSEGWYRNGRLTVSTMDCCVVGDQWGVRIIKQNGSLMAEGVGTGAIDAFTGAASVPSLPGKAVTVEVFYVDGVDIWPAGLTVRFEFGGENLLITQLP